MDRKLLYRARQYGMSRVVRAVKQREPYLLEGKNSLLCVPGLLKDKNINKVMIVTSPGFIRRGTLQPFMRALEGESISCAVFSEVMPDPTVLCAEKACAYYKAETCEAFIAIGGGSVIDCTKTAAAIYASGKTVRQMKGTLKVMKRLPVVIAVPTTAGTGSEATSAAVITDTVNGLHYKYALSDPCLIPYAAVLDPVLSVSMPPNHTAATGMDALTHAVESYTNLFASAGVKRHALSAVRLISEYLLKAYEDGSDLENREKMLKASYEAGIAFTNNFVGYVHAVAHACGALYGLGHGELNACILPAVLEHYGSKVYHSLSELAEAAGIQGSTEREKAQAFIQMIRELNEKTGLSAKIAPLKKDDYEEIITRALTEANPAYPVPVIWDRKDLEEVLDSLLPEG